MTWVKNRNGFIISALKMVKAIDAKATTAPQEWINEGADKFNAIISDLTNKGFDVLKLDFRTKTLTASSEVTGTDGNIYTCIKGGVATALNKPVAGADYLSMWYPRGSTGGVWTLGTTYTSIGDFDLDSDVLEVKDCFIRDNTGDDEPPLTQMSAYEYMATEDKYTLGLPDYVYIDYSTDNYIPHAYLYYQPDSTSYVFHYLAVIKMKSIDSASAIPDINPRFYDYLMYKLAEKLADVGGGLSIGEKQELERKANILFLDCKKYLFYKDQGSHISYGAYQTSQNLRRSL